MIYCVEDDDNIRELVIYTLETTGLKARGFADGSAFTEALAFETPELILLDIMLPGEDGLEILKKLKCSSKTKSIPVIMVTAKGSEYDKVIGLDSGAEALVRWKKADGTIVSPGDFIPVFESNGFIIRLDYYVWDQVCQFIKNNLAHRGDSEVISVNVSRVNLYNPDFLESLVNLVEKYKIPPKYLNLELTESAFSDDARMIQNAVDYLHKAGFTILMDDFGSGYSSLNVLKDIDIDVLKIDMRFLSKGSSEERGEKILEAVIKMAKSLDMLVIAEGVEEEKQVKMLKRLGCDYIQGYYFAKPMPKKDYVKLLQKSR